MRGQLKMPADQIFVCFLVFSTIALFVWEKFPPDLVAMSVLLLLFLVPIDGRPVLSSDASVLGYIFGNSGLLTITFMFIVGAAMEKTGMVGVLGQWFEKLSGKSHLRIMLVLGLLVATSSAFLNNTTVVVVFMPMLLGLCRRLQLPPSRYLIPLSYFAIGGGLCTMIGTSTNLIVNGILLQKGIPQFGIFDITPLGITLTLAIIGFMLLFGKKLLPDRTSLATLLDDEDGREFLTAAIVSGDSPLVGKALQDTVLAKNRSMRVIEVRRGGNRVETPLNLIKFEPGDRIIVKSHLSGLMGMDAVTGLENAAKSELGLSYARTERAVLMEGMIGPHSRFAGHTLNDLNFRQQFGLLILAIHRQGENLRTNFENVTLNFGDTLLLEGSPERMRELFAERDMINLTKPKHDPLRRNKAWLAVLALMLVVGFGSTDLVPFEWVAMGAALLVTMGGCLKKEDAYNAIDWPILTTILGTLGLGVAMDHTGAAQTIVHSVVEVAKNWDPRIIVSLVLLTTIILTELLSNQAVAALLTPLAIALAADLGLGPHPFVAAVMVGASIGFAVPAGYQTHMLVYGAGGYRFSDFFRTGIALDVLLWILGSLLIPVFWAITAK